MRSLAAAGALLLAAGAAHWGTADDGATPPPTETMGRLALALRGLTGALADGELETAAESATAIRSALALHDVEPRRNAHLTDDFAYGLARLDGLAAEVERLAAGGRLDGARQATQELRSSCVECHVRFRPENDPDRLYPATRGTIAGTLGVLDVEGEPREERWWNLVFLDVVKSEPTYTHAREHPRLSQAGMEFQPRVLPVVKGATVEFPNDDTLFHNVFSLSKTAPFDLDVYPPGETRAVRMERTGLVTVHCNIHANMAASVVVLNNRFFALTDRDGGFVIPDVPPGRYRLRAWNELGGAGETEVVVDGRGLFEASFELREQLRPAPHKNKFGRPYGSKY